MKNTENTTIKKTSFYKEEDNNFQAQTTEKKQVAKENEKNENIKESTNQKTNDKKEQHSNILNEVQSLLKTAETNLTNPENIQKEYEEISEELFSNLAAFGLYYRTLSVFQANVDSFMNKYGEEEVNKAAFQLLNLMAENAVYVDYYYSMLMKNAMFNLNISVVEVKERVTFTIDLLFEIMKDNFNIENPKEEYYKIYNQLIFGVEN